MEMGDKNIKAILAYSIGRLVGEDAFPIPGFVLGAS